MGRSKRSARLASRKSKPRDEEGDDHEATNTGDDTHDGDGNSEHDMSGDEGGAPPSASASVASSTCASGSEREEVHSPATFAELSTAKRKRRQTDPKHDGESGGDERSSSGEADVAGEMASSRSSESTKKQRRGSGRATRQKDSAPKQKNTDVAALATNTWTRALVATAAAGSSSTKATVTTARSSKSGPKSTTSKVGAKPQPKMKTLTSYFKQKDTGVEETKSPEVPATGGDEKGSHRVDEEEGSASKEPEMDAALATKAMGAGARARKRPPTEKESSSSKKTKQKSRIKYGSVSSYGEAELADDSEHQVDSLPPANRKDTEEKRDNEDESQPKDVEEPTATPASEKNASPETSGKTRRTYGRRRQLQDVVVEKVLSDLDSSDRSNASTLAFPELSRVRSSSSLSEIDTTTKSSTIEKPAIADGGGDSLMASHSSFKCVHSAMRTINERDTVDVKPTPPVDESESQTVSGHGEEARSDPLQLHPTDQSVGVTSPVEDASKALTEASDDEKIELEESEGMVKSDKSTSDVPADESSNGAGEVDEPKLSAIKQMDVGGENQSVNAEESPAFEVQSLIEIDNNIPLETIEKVGDDTFERHEEATTTTPERLNQHELLGEETLQDNGSLQKSLPGSEDRDEIQSIPANSPPQNIDEEPNVDTKVGEKSKAASNDNDADVSSKTGKDDKSAEVTNDDSKEMPFAIAETESIIHRDLKSDVRDSPTEDSSTMEGVEEIQSTSCEVGFVRESDVGNEQSTPISGIAVVVNDKTQSSASEHATSTTNHAATQDVALPLATVQSMPSEGEELYDVDNVGTDTSTPPVVANVEPEGSLPGVAFKFPTATDKKQMPSLGQLKMALFLEASKVHRGTSAERRFANYWETLERYITLGSHGQVSSVSKVHSTCLDRFLKTHKMKRLHNKLVLGKLNYDDPYVCAFFFASLTCIAFR